jgi:hypothetical protein
MGVVMSRPEERDSRLGRRRPASCLALQYGRCVGQLPRLVAVNGIVLSQMLRDRLDPGDHALLEVSCLEGLFHLATDALPFVRAHPAVDAAIGHDFHSAIGQQQVDEHAITMFGIPHP